MTDSIERKPRPAVSIVIVTWNVKRYSLECLKSLREQGKNLTLETIVVDNASTDGTPEAIREFFPEVHLIQSKSNLGFTRANNLGLKRFRGKYICLINPDVVVPPGCLEKMCAYMEENPRIGLLGPKMLSPGGGVGHSVQRHPTVWNTFCSALGFHAVFKNSKLFGGYMMTGFPYDKTEDVEVLTGWFWMVRPSALAEVGLLEEQFFMYGDDIDWSYRFHRAGWRVVFYAEAEALHYQAGATNNAPALFYIEMRRANLQYFKKHHGSWGWFGFLMVTWLHELVRVGAYSAVFLFNGKRRREASFKFKRSLASLGWLAGVKSTPERKLGGATDQSPMATE